MITATEINKAASAAFFTELQALIEAGELPSDFLEKVGAAELDQMLKEALGLADVRQRINSAASRISPTLAKPVSQVAHDMQHSKNPFVAGVGNVLHHKSTSTGKGLLAMANPVGTAAEMVAGGAGNAAAHGIARAGGAIQKATGAADAVIREGRAMTPKGRMMNAFEQLGGGVQKAFSQGGTGHNVLTKHLPVAAEIGGAVGAGMLAHAPVGLAGALGKAGLVGLGKAAPVAAAAIDHAPHALGHAAPALRGAGEVLHHGAVDVLGTAKQSLLGRMGGAARRMFPTPALAPA